MPQGHHIIQLQNEPIIWSTMYGATFRYTLMLFSL